jgi:hypothetical protein
MNVGELSRQAVILIRFDWRVWIVAVFYELIEQGGDADPVRGPFSSL